MDYPVPRPMIFHRCFREDISVAGRLRSESRLEWTLVPQILQKSQNSLTCTMFFFCMLDEDPILWFFGPEPMKGWYSFWPIHISVVGCHILPKECPILLVWIPFYLLLQGSSYSKHCILMQQNRGCLICGIHTLHIQEYLHGSWWL